MTIALDTSVLVAALVAAHPHHARARPYLDRARSGEVQLSVASHALAEVYATLTVYPGFPKLTPADVQRLLDQDVLAHAQVVALGRDDYAAVLDRLVGLSLVSGAVYDALHVRAAEKAGAGELVTINGRDFLRMPPADPCRLVVL